MSKNPNRLSFAARGTAFVLTSGSLALVSAGCGQGVPTHTAQTVEESHYALSSCVTLPLVADATLQSPPMTKNLGTAPTLRVGGKAEALLQFDLGPIPVAAALNRATLTLSVAGADGDEDETDAICELDGAKGHHCPAVNAHRVLVPWLEPSVTFASFAQRFDPTSVGTISVTSTHSSKTVDLTSLVRSWVTGAKPNFGLLLESKSRRTTTFVSREGGLADQRPVLQVCFTTPDDHCAPSPCQHGASCTNNATGYTCACAPGYTGTNCETLMDNCGAHPCLNGSACSNRVNGYSCACPIGYAGTNCETNIDDCATAPCLNGGVCQDGIGSYTCFCPTGYTGANCATLINNCVANPCLNAGLCQNAPGSYTCRCAAGFTGTNCEINVDDCVRNACQNGATCIDGINVYTCSCPPDWGGTNCEYSLNTCAQRPCLNGAACTNGVGNYACNCAPGYTGTNCEIDINECAVNPCKNGGICVDAVNTYACRCTEDFFGSNCEFYPIPNEIVVREGPSPEQIIFEEGVRSSRVFRVHLAQRPLMWASATVLVTLSTPGVGVSPSALTFNDINFNDDQYVTVTGAVHDNDVRNEFGDLRFSTPWASDRIFSVTVRDDDIQSIVSEYSVVVREGQAVLVPVRLAFRPSTDVVIAATVAGPIATVSGGPLVFTSANYDVIQYFVVTGQPDANLVTDTTTMILEVISFQGDWAPEGAARTASLVSVTEN